MQSSKDTSTVSYDLLAGTVHAFTLHRATRDTTADFMTLYRPVFEGHDRAVPFKVLIDTRASGIPSIRSMFSAVRDLYKEHAGNMPEIHIAYLYEDAMMINIARSFLEMLRIRSNRRFFEGDQFDTALNWVQNQPQMFATSTD